MKKVLIALFLLAVVGSLFAAAPSMIGYIKTPADKVVNDSQWTATKWEIVDSLIYNLTDTSRIFVKFVATASLDPGERLYFSCSHDSVSGGATYRMVPDEDTVVLIADPTWRSTTTQTLFFNYRDSCHSQTDKKDTVYFLAAVGGSGESIDLKNIWIEGRVADQDSLDAGAQ